MHLQLKGIPAVIAIVLFVAGAAGYRMFLHSSLPDDPKLRQQLELSLQSEIAGAIMADTQAIEDAIAVGDKDTATKLAQGVLQRKVEITDLAMKGGGDDIIVKAHYKVHGPQGVVSKVDYFQYSHSPITGWRYRRGSSALSWHLKLF